MNPHFWWYVARAAGLSSWLFGATSITTGLLLSSDATTKPRPNWQLDLHRYQGAVSLSLLGLHVSALIADSYSHFSATSVLVPFASEWRRGAVAWGVIAMWVFLAVEVSSLMRRRIGKRTWKVIHMSSLGAFAASTVHFITAGTDARNRLALVAIAVVCSLNTGLLVFRVLAAPRARRPFTERPSRPSSTTSQPLTAKPVPAEAWHDGAR
jgi:Ferric reductase like transmembrane component